MSEQEQRPPENRVAEAMRDIDLLCTFAYERGFHEMGYNPVKVVGDFIAKATEELRVVEKEIDVPSQALLMLGEVTP